MAGLQQGGPGVLVEGQDRAHVGPSHGHLHRQVEEPGVPVSHPVFVEQVLDNLSARRFVRYAERLVLDVRSEALGVHLYRRLQMTKNIYSH